MLEELGVDEAARAVVEGTVDGDDVALGDKVFEVFDTAGVDGLGGGYRQTTNDRARMTRGVKGAYVRGEACSRSRGAPCSQTAPSAGERGSRYAPRRWSRRPCPPSQTRCGPHPRLASHRARSSSAPQRRRVSIPAVCAPRITHLVGGNKVPDEEENGHEDMLGDGDDVRARDFQHLHALLDGGVEVNVVRANTGRDAELQVFGLGAKTEHTVTPRSSADMKHMTAHTLSKRSAVR